MKFDLKTYPPTAVAINAERTNYYRKVWIALALLVIGMGGFLIMPPSPWQHLVLCVGLAGMAALVFLSSAIGEGPDSGIHGLNPVTDEQTVQARLWSQSNDEIGDYYLDVMTQGRTLVRAEFALIKKRAWKNTQSVVSSQITQ